MNLNDQTDRTLFQHYLYVFNQTVLLLRDKGATPAVREKVLKLLWRLRIVIKQSDAKETKKYVEALEEFVATFASGGNRTVGKLAGLVF
jgi:hypothetical protein